METYALPIAFLAYLTVITIYGIKVEWRDL
jgi:hypothetical protein